MGPLAVAMPSSLAFPHKLLLPLLSRHRLSADLLALYVHAVDEQAEVLAERHQRPMLVVHLHAHRAVGLLTDLGDRVERGLVEVFGRLGCEELAPKAWPKWTYGPNGEQEDRLQ